MIGNNANWIMRGGANARRPVDKPGGGYKYSVAGAHGPIVTLASRDALNPRCLPGQVGPPCRTWRTGDFQSFEVANARMIWRIELAASERRLDGWATEHLTERAEAPRWWHDGDGVASRLSKMVKPQRRRAWVYAAPLSPCERQRRLHKHPKNPAWICLTVSLGWA